MATATQTQTQSLKKTKLVCFSFAAYAKTLMQNLRNLNIPISPGLTPQEFASLESTFKFSFPPDLRSILQEGLPIGPHFPNWRSSSSQQLQILLNLPSLNLSKNVLQNNFWVDSWGQKPENSNQALDIAKRLLNEAPVLIPIYGNCYIPSSPNAAGNPMFYVDNSCVRVLSFDLSRFFEELEFYQTGGVHFIRSVNLTRNDKVSLNVPAWAAKAARRIEFWTEVAERGRKKVARVESRGWWSTGDWNCWQLGSCLEEVFWRLRDGGWREEEVREMMMMMDGGDDEIQKECGTRMGKEDVAWHVSVLSVVLLRGGWSREDVAYSLDLQDIDDSCGIGKCLLDFQISNGSCSREDDDHQKSSTNQLMNLRSLKV